MMTEIRRKAAAGKFEFSKHAADQVIIRGIAIDGIPEAFASGEIIEDYPDDRYGPSCLVYGNTLRGRYIHIQCSYPERDYLKIVTIYEPDPEAWLDFRVRKGV